MPSGSRRAAPCFISAGTTQYETMEGEWWSDPAKGGTPPQNLLLHLGLTDCTMGTPETFSPIEWTDNSSYQDALDQAGVLWIKDDGFQGNMLQGSGFETILSAGDDAVGIDCAVGKGHVVASSLSSGIYSESATGAELLRQLTRYALRYTNYRYQSADAFTARRGNYTAVHSVKGETSLEGVYVNIFDSRLSVVENPVVRQGESALYYDISSLERSIPRLVYTGSILRGTQTEEADQTVFEVTGAENALISSRIVAPQGRYPASVEAKNADGAPMGTAVEWDEASQSLLVQTHAGPDAPTTVTVRWDSAGDSVPAASHYEDFILKTNLEGEDEAFLFSNTAAANDQVRFCDLDGQLVYRFDLDQYPAAVLSLQLSQNYIVEVSPDNQDYTVVYDVSQEYDHRVASENIGMRCVVPSEYGMTSGEMYLRIRNTDPTAGWGGAISQLAVKYTVDGPSGEYR